MRTCGQLQYFAAADCSLMKVACKASMRAFRRTVFARNG